MAGSILIVEDRASLRRLLERALSQDGYTVTAVPDAQSAVEALEREGFDLVLTDLKLPDATGIDVLHASKQARPETPVVVMTAFGSVATAVEAMKIGAADFLQKPVEIDELSRLVASLVKRDPLSETGAYQVPQGPLIVGRHPRLRAALRLLERVAPTESTVLLTGESGTGKELFARAIHACSPRSQGPFVALNCAAIPESLIENELFGHEKGAFTGAVRRQAGRFEEARRGTLLLDEIGELGLSVQSKVLRVLEDRTFQRVGGGATEEADVRLVAATNRDLKAMVEAGTFRSDLYFRLDVFPIELPPLRERPSDIPLLARHILARLAERHRVSTPQLSDEAEAMLAEEPWPGNVRQLANVLERALILAGDEPRLGRETLEALIQPLQSRDDRQVLRSALEEADGDKKQAAKILGVSYRTLLRRIKEHDLEGYPRYRRD